MEDLTIILKRIEDYFKGRDVIYLFSDKDINRKMVHKFYCNIAGNYDKDTKRSFVLILDSSGGDIG